MASARIDALAILRRELGVFVGVELTWPRQQARWRFVSGWVQYVNVHNDVRISTTATPPTNRSPRRRHLRAVRAHMRLQSATKRKRRPVTHSN